MDAVETMAWTNETPWHGLGFEVSNKLTPKQMQVASKTDWLVEKRELMYPSTNGVGSLKVPGKFGLVRVTDERCLSIVGSTYKPVQNDVSFDFFKKFVLAGHMKMETAGSLHGGQYVWVLARIGADFKLGKEDEVRGFLLLCNPHIFGKSLVIKFTPIRVVCWNTLTWALGGALTKGAHSEGTFRMPHSVAFTAAVQEQAEQALGIAKKQMDEFKQAAQLLSKTKITKEQTEEFFCEVLRFDPKEAERKLVKAKTKKQKDEEVIIEPRMLPRLRFALENSPGANMATAEGTLWGAVNAVSFVVDHELGRDQSASLRTAWLGAKANLKRRAIDLALARAA